MTGSALADAGTERDPSAASGITARLGRLWLRSPRAARSLLLGRAFEQGSLAIAAVALGRALGTSAFAAAGALLVVNSVAMALADYGLGINMLRLAPGATVASSSLRRVRVVNGVVALVAVVLGSVVGGDAGTVLGWSGPLWAAAGEAYIRKAAAIRVDDATRARRAEVAGAVALVVGVAAAWTSPSVGLVALAGGLLAKHLVEVVVAGRCDALVGQDGERSGLTTWGTQVVSAATANLDYLIAGILLGPVAFSAYLLGFRVANAFTSQIASVSGRLSFVDFGGAVDVVERQRVLDRYLRGLVPLGVVFGVVTAIGAVPLAAVLGPGWSDVRVIVPVLAVMVPWRIFGHLAGCLTIAVGRGQQLLRWELVRLVVAVVALLVAAPLGLVPFTAAVTILWIGTVAVYLRAATATAGLEPLRWLGPAAVGSVIGTVGLACALAVVVG